MTTPLQSRNQILTSLGEHEQAEAHPPFDCFLLEVRERLRRGRIEFQDRSLERPAVGLLAEIQEELADVAGWSAILWSRLQRIREAAERVDPERPLHTPPNRYSNHPALTDREHALRILGGRAE